MLSRLAHRSLFRTRHITVSALRSPNIVWQWHQSRHIHRISNDWDCYVRTEWLLHHFRRSTIRPIKQRTSRRSLFTEAVPPLLLPPVVFLGLLLMLWTWKCVMMVLFQDKIIYMPSMPPFARREKIQDYVNADAVCNGVKWEEERIKSQDGVKLSVLIGRVVSELRQQDKSAMSNMEDFGQARNVYIVYFQGNGSSLPPRIPLLSAVLRSIQTRTAIDAPVRYTSVALSYRGYWTSSGRASQRGIELDAQAVLEYIDSTLVTPESGSEIVLWGQSIGAGVATTAAARYIELQFSSEQSAAGLPRISGMVLETPFTSVKNMLIALYPQKWLPYRYLHPFLWNRWDSEEALKRIARSPDILNPRIMLLPATRDEVVPPEDAGKLEDLCKGIGLDVRRVDVLGALHHEATLRKDGQEAVAGFVVDTVLGSKEREGKG